MNNEVTKLMREQLKTDDELIKTLHKLINAQHDTIEFLMHNLMEAYETLNERDDALLELDVLDDESLNCVLEEKEIINNMLYELKQNLE